MSNDFNLTAVYSMKVIFICPTPNNTANFTPSKSNVSTPKFKVPFPVKITSINRRGSVEIRFLLSVSAPNLTRPANNSNDSDERQLSVDTALPTPDQLINRDVLKVQLQTKYAVLDLDWRCTDFTDQTIILQLNFTDPMEISQNHLDQLVVTFLQTNLFILSARDEYLFANDS